MSEDLDLFGNPAAAGYGKRGRPAFVPTPEDRNKIKLLLALGWSIDRMANALGVSAPTVKRHFRSELKVRDGMRDQLEARMVELAMAEANKGNMTALKELARLVERNDLMLYGQSAAPRRPRAEKEQKMGKKDAERQAALEPDTSSTLGELMALRQAPGGRVN